MFGKLPLKVSEVLKCTEVQQHLFDKNREPPLAEVVPVTKQETERVIKRCSNIWKDTRLTRKNYSEMAAGTLVIKAEGYLSY